MESKLYYNGDILTLEEPLYAEAILIENGTIKKLGSFDDVCNYKDENTILIDLKGRTLMPSFIDSHSHITSFASTLGLVPLAETKSFDDIINIIQKYINEHELKDGEWVIGFGYDHNCLEEREHPDKNVIDKASFNLPIAITHASGHMGVFNSKALELAEITSETEAPSGGIIGRINGTNEPNGYLEENAFMRSSSIIPEPSLDKMLELLTEAQKVYFKYGITTAQDGFVKENEFRLLDAASKQNKILLDIVGYVDIKDNKKIVTDNKHYLNNYINNFKLGGYKAFLDGSPQGKTAWMTEPYENEEEGYRGYPIYADREVKRFLEAALDENVQIIVHCNGDAACEQYMRAFSDTGRPAEYINKIRPVMIHAQTVRADQLKRMGEIGMIASFFIAHIYFWGDIHLENLGKYRACRISPAQTAIDNRVVYNFHQDTPVVPPNMLHTVWSAVNRVTKNCNLLGCKERISVLEALKGVTINAAYQYFEEDKKGSLKEGKAADLIILDRNPLKVDPIDIKNIIIEETIKAGKTVYRI